MANIEFGKTNCTSIDLHIQKEWLESNGLGGYASSSIFCCNTRKYHGLLVANLAKPEGRHVLLSTIEETLKVKQKEFHISCRKHPEVFYPDGWKYLKNINSSPYPTFDFTFDNLCLRREIMMLQGQNTTLFRYTLTKAPHTKRVSNKKLIEKDQYTLTLKPLLAYRNFHNLTHCNIDLQVKTFPIDSGFTLQPYTGMPAFFAKTDAKNYFYPSPDWYYNIEYPEEQKRGFAFTEDLFMPGVMEIEMELDASIIFAVSTDEIPLNLAKLWQNENLRREKQAKKIAENTSAQAIQRLSLAARHFIITTPYGNSAILAGYHWFEAWGRDSMIALPGLTFYAGREKEALKLLADIGKSAKDGLIPNFFHPDGKNHAYNSIDASLWYIWAVQQLHLWSDKHTQFIKKNCWPVIKEILKAFMGTAIPTVFTDEHGLLHAGNKNTQLTWMDATVNRQPVTPRHGCPVEINALWYNALCFAKELADKFKETPPVPYDFIKQLQERFVQKFYLPAGYLADTWDNSNTDKSIRPNQIFAVSLPYSMLNEQEQKNVTNKVKEHLLTSFGLRTLSPADKKFCKSYFGSVEQRDNAYHQGTVWPWLIGAYGEACLRIAADKEKTGAEILEVITPLVTEHLKQAGLDFISEIFDATPPFTHNGCIAQAWSVAETLRLLCVLQKRAPKSFAKWQLKTEGSK